MPYMRAYAERENGLSFVASTEAEARDGMVIRQDRWLLGNYRANPVFLWAHDYTTLPLGTLDVSVEDGKLRARVGQWRDAPFPREVAAAYEAGILSATSVGWDNISAEDARRRGYTEVPADAPADDVYHELLDISAVPVPGDPTALVERQRSAIAALTRELVRTTRGAMPPHDAPKADEAVEWDAAAATGAVSGEDALRMMHAWVDPDGDPEAKDSYKLPHHDAEGRVVWRGVAAAMGALMGSMGGVDIPGGDVRGVHAHLARHYAAFAKEPPPLEVGEEGTTEGSEPSTESARDSWEEVAAAMVAVLDPDSEDTDKARRRRYNSLLPAYRRLGKVAPEYMTGVDLRALGPDEWAGLWLEGELEHRAGKVIRGELLGYLDDARALIDKCIAAAKSAPDGMEAARVTLTNPVTLGGDTVDSLAEMLRSLTTDDDTDRAPGDPADPTLAELAHWRAVLGA